MELTDKRIVTTPEGVPIELILAGLGSRFIAILIDTIIQTVIIYLLSFLYHTLTLSSFVFQQSAFITDILVAMLIILLFIVTIGYFIVFEMLTGGRSPGKMIAKIKVVDVDGKGLTLRASITRNLIRIIDMLPTYYFVGATFVFFNQKNQRVGDLFANTVVIQYQTDLATKRTNWRQLSWINAVNISPQLELNQFYSNYGNFTIPPQLSHLDITQLNYNDVTILQNFLLRRYQLPPEVREKLANNLASALSVKIGGYDGNWPPEVLLETIVALKSLK